MEKELIILVLIFIVVILLTKRQKVSKQELKEIIKSQTKDIEDSKILIQSVIDGTEDLIFYKDKDFRYLGCNIAFTKFVGIPFEKIIGKNDYEMFGTEMADIFRENDKKVILSNKLNTNEELVTYPDGTKVLLFTSKSPFKYKKDQIGILGVSKDIDELNRLKDEQLKQQKILLTQSKIAAVGEMIGNIAHQWRQPLTVITTNVTSLKLDIDMGETITNEAIQKCADDVLKQSEYLSKTIDDFRDFFNNDDENLKECNLEDTFKKLNELTKDIFNNNYINYQLDIENSLSVKINENLFIQAFLNIYNNAKDVLSNRIHDTDKRYFLVNIKKDNNSVQITLQDSGNGIEEKVIDKIFEPYFTTKHSSIGTGIGLYMTNQIITKHLNGNISVSNVDFKYNGLDLKGAQFKVVIPL